MQNSRCREGQIQRAENDMVRLNFMESRRPAKKAIDRCLDISICEKMQKERCNVSSTSRYTESKNQLTAKAFSTEQQDHTTHDSESL
eukprot:48574-Hanusia_phi.AAC.1